MAKSKIVMGCDGAGYVMKAFLKEYLEGDGFEIVDVGCHSEEMCDYPIYARDLAYAIRDGKTDKGILVCGSGIGICIAANRYPWIRAATVYDETAARMTRAHNDANVMCLGGMLSGQWLARDCAEVFLNTEWDGNRPEGARHVPRIKMLDDPNSDFEAFGKR